jgi:hypothetical protein
MANADSAEAPNHWRRCVASSVAVNERTTSGWCIYFADTGEVVIYCPECAGREFGD